MVCEIAVNACENDYFTNYCYLPDALAALDRL